MNDSNGIQSTGVRAARPDTEKFICEALGNIGDKHAIKALQDYSNRSSIDESNNDTAVKALKKLSGM